MYVWIELSNANLCSLLWLEANLFYMSVRIRVRFP
jgi:hypothetical protein